MAAKLLASLAVYLLLSCTCGAQTVKIKCNSAENLHIALIGTDNDGHRIKKMLYDVTQGFRKKFSVFREKYGYDNYDNASMVHEPADSTSRWSEMLIYNNSNTFFNRVDLTHSIDNATLEGSAIWVRVRHQKERGYTITEVIINDL